MQTEIAKRTMARIWFYVAVVILVASVWGIQNYAYQRIFTPSDGVVLSESSTTAPNEPDDWQKMAVQAMTQSNALLTTLGTALLGALGLLLSNRKEGSKPRHLWAVFLAAAAGGLSLFFGYVSHSNILWMISVQKVSPYSPGYLYWSHAQFYTLLAGAFFAADFAVHDLSGRELT
jgi:LPXTG-motif cell wall-anchored protein